MIRRFTTKKKRPIKKTGGTPTTGDHLHTTKVVRLKDPYTGTCSQCQQQRRLTHQVETMDGRWGHVCHHCGEALTTETGE